MSSSISVQPLAGVYGSAPLAYLLQINETRILLDAGWDERFDVDVLAPLEAAAERIDAVLLSHASLSHLGALPYLAARRRLAGTPVFCTAPVARMGQLELYDAYLAQRAVSTALSPIRREANICAH